MIMMKMILKIGVMKRIKTQKNIGSQKDKIDKIDKIHDYLDSLPAVGKVLSFASIIEVATQLNNNKPLGTLEMGVLYTKFQETIKKKLSIPTFLLKIMKQE